MRTPELRTSAERFAKNESGSNALEYGLIVALVSLAIVVGATAAGTALNGMFNTLGAQIGVAATKIVG